MELLSGKIQGLWSVVRLDYKNDNGKKIVG